MEITSQSLSISFEGSEEIVIGIYDRSARIFYRVNFEGNSVPLEIVEEVR